jgi:hypothetical protein
MRVTLYILLFFSSSLQAQFMLLADGPTPQPPVFQDPSDVSGLYAWYVASDMDADGIENEESGTAEATWADKSGNGYSLTRTGAPTISTRNGYNVVSFDGVDDRYQASSASDWAFLHDGNASTVIFVGQVAFVADPGELYGVISTGNITSATLGWGVWYQDNHSTVNNAMRILITVGVGNNRIVTDVAGTRVADAWLPNQYNYLRFETECSLPTADMFDYYVNGTQQTFVNAEPQRTPSILAPAYPLTIMAMGDGTYVCPGEVAEIIIYNRKLTAQEVSDVEGYIATKYNL